MMKANRESKAIIYQSEIDYISKCILDYPNIETGGDFFGFWTHSGIPVIQYVIGPGPKSNHQDAFFNQDEKYLIDFGEILQKRHGLQHLGSWHSHHKLGLVCPSGYDAKTMKNAIRNNNLRKFLMILGNITSDGSTIVNGFLFYKNKDKYLDVGWILLDSISPIRIDIENSVSNHLIYKPKTKEARLIKLKTTSLDKNIILKPNFEPGSWIDSKNGQEELKVIHQNLESRYGKVKITSPESKSLNLSFAANNELYTVIFQSNFPNSYPIIAKKINDNFQQINEADDSNDNFIYEKPENIYYYIESYIRNIPDSSSNLESKKVEDFSELKDAIICLLNNEFRELFDSSFSEKCNKKLINQFENIVVEKINSYTNSQMKEYLLKTANKEELEVANYKLIKNSIDEISTKVTNIFSELITREEFIKLKPILEDIKSKIIEEQKQLGEQFIFFSRKVEDIIEQVKRELTKSVVEFSDKDKENRNVIMANLSNIQDSLKNHEMIPKINKRTDFIKFYSILTIVLLFALIFQVFFQPIKQTNKSKKDLEALNYKVENYEAMLENEEYILNNLGINKELLLNLKPQYIQKFYVKVEENDSLNIILRKFDIDTSTLLSLNPFLRNREEFSLNTEDSIQVGLLIKGNVEQVKDINE